MFLWTMSNDNLTWNPLAINNLVSYLFALLLDVTWQDRCNKWYPRIKFVINNGHYWLFAQVGESYIPFWSNIDYLY